MKLIDRINEANTLIANNPELLKEKKEDILTDEIIDTVIYRTNSVYDGCVTAITKMLHSAYLMGFNDSKLIERFKIEDQLKQSLWGKNNND